VGVFAPCWRALRLNRYIVTLIGTLLSVFYFKWRLVSFGFVLLQFAALTWYVATLRPLATGWLGEVVLGTAARAPLSSAAAD
jgi:hypothetical protein